MGIALFGWCLFVTLGYGAIGWIDDYRKIVHHDPHGMSAREKFSWQSVIGLAAAFYLALALAVVPDGTFAEAIGAWYDARFSAGRNGQYSPLLAAVD